MLKDAGDVEGEIREMNTENQSKPALLTTQSLVFMGVMIAIQVVLARFASINAWNIRIGFGFVPVMFSAMLLGPLGGGIVGGIADFLGSMLFPSGVYFPGFTATAFLTGVIFGCFMHRKPTFGRILSAVLLNQLIVTLGLNTLWISILYGSPYLPLLSTRILQSIFYVIVHTVIGVVLARLPVRKLSYSIG